MTFNKLNNCNEEDMLTLRNNDLQSSKNRIGSKHINEPTKDLERERIEKLEREIEHWKKEVYNIMNW